MAMGEISKEGIVYVSSPNRMLVRSELYITVVIFFSVHSRQRVSKELKKLQFSNPGEKMKVASSAVRCGGHL